jgi:hypothetical protein
MRRIKFKDYAGFKIKGTEPISGTARNIHLKKASWLTAMVESGGKFGSVMNYDGTAMTAGIHQAIAVYPRELKHPDKNLRDDQGPLWKLLRLVQPVTGKYDLWKEFERVGGIGWYIAPDNTVRWKSHGNLVSGLNIREELTGSADGCAPASGYSRKVAENWVKLFHEVFSDPATFDIQEEYGMEHFVKRASRAKCRFALNKDWQKLTLEFLVYGGTALDLVTLTNDPELDLAMCMYWAHSVNAPGFALKKINRTLGALFGPNGSRKKFARILIRKLGNTTFGHWSDDLKNGRYQRTRTYAMKSSFWPQEFFKGPKAIMPYNLPG